jgi:hypothetical protein
MSEFFSVWLVVSQLIILVFVGIADTKLKENKELLKKIIRRLENE